MTMINSNHGRLMCIPKCTHANLVDHIPTYPSAYMMPSRLPSSKKRSPVAKLPKNMGLKEEIQKNSFSRSRIYTRSSPQQLSPDRASSRNMEYLRPFSVSKETS